MRSPPETVATRGVPQLFVRVPLRYRDVAVGLPSDVGLTPGHDAKVAFEVNSQQMQARGPFGPKGIGEGRVRVYGCSPGCLLLSLGVSVLLTILVNVLIRLF